MIFWMECYCGNVWEVDEDIYETRAPTACPDCDCEPQVRYVYVDGFWKKVD